MILGIATSSPPPQLLILTWPTICHFILVNTWPVFCLWPRTWQVVTTRGKLSTPGHRLSTRIKLSTRGKLSKSVSRIQMIKSHMFGKISQVHIEDSFYSLGAWEREHSCDNKTLFTAMLAFTTFLAPHLNIRVFCDNIPRITWYKVTQPPPIIYLCCLVLTCVLPVATVNSDPRYRRLIPGPSAPITSDPVLPIDPTSPLFPEGWKVLVSSWQN